MPTVLNRLAGARGPILGNDTRWYFQQFNLPEICPDVSSPQWRDKNMLGSEIMRFTETEKAENRVAFQYVTTGGKLNAISLNILVCP